MEVRVLKMKHDDWINKQEIEHKKHKVNNMWHRRVERYNTDDTIEGMLHNYRILT